MSKRDSDGMSAEMSSPSSTSHGAPLSSSASTAQTSLELTSPTFNSFNQEVRTSPMQEQDDFLGVVSRWGQEEGTARRGDAVRLSKMIGSTFGPASRPPPGPPPSAPPPLPPTGSSRPPRTTISPFRRPTGPAASPPPPAHPPPSGALPALPIAPPPSTPVKAESISSRSRTSSQRRSATPPPRTTSLLTPAQLEAESGPSSLALSIPSTSNGSSSGSPSSPLRSGQRPPRTPSRHLLQSALDLAQRAVEMDKNNDVVGALEAYREAVSRLKNVMERVGVEPGKDDGRKKRNGKAEEEGRTLKGIHDAYVARIQLLISYDTGDQPPSSEDSGEPSPDSFLGTTHPSTSTATLVPKSPESPRGERTPRPSLDDTTREFGELALDANDDTIRPGAALASPFTSSREQTLSLNEESPMQRQGGGIIVPPRVGSQGLAKPESPTSAHSHDTMSPTSSTRSRGSRRKPARPSIGLENELDLQISEGEEDMEVLEKTPQLGSTSRMTPGSDLSPRRFPDAFDTDRPLPPLPSSASTRSTSSHEGQPKIHARHASLGRNVMLVSPSTALGTISQRRQKSTMDPPAAGQNLQQISGIDGLPGGATFPSRTPSTGASGLSSIFPPRLRTRSQPSRAGPEEVPPLPTPSIRHKGSFGSHHKSSMLSISRAFKNSSEVSRLDALSLAPPASSSPPSASSAARSLGPPSVASASGSLMSPLPESQPNELIHRPFHLLRLLQRSMDPNSSGSYLTAKIHISSAVWKPAIWPKSSSGVKALGPPKIAGQEAKVRIMESLIINMGIISRTGLGLLDGPREFRPDGSEGLVDPNLSRAMNAVAEELCAALDALEEEMDASHKLLTKSGVTVGGWKGKKSGSAKSWGSKFSKTMDKITNNKAVESPDRYVDLLYNFCAHIQVIGDHLSCIVGPCTQSYSALPDRSFSELKARLLRSSDFVSVVIVPWLLDDFKQFFLRYLKGGVRYMEE